MSPLTEWRRRNTKYMALSGAPAGLGNASLASCLNGVTPSKLTWIPPAATAPGANCGWSVKASGPKAFILNVELSSTAPDGIRSSTPPEPVTVPPPGPIAVVPSAATNWLRSNDVLAPNGLVTVIRSKSLMVACIEPDREPSFPAVNERTNPLEASTIKTVLPGGSEPAGALT